MAGVKTTHKDYDKYLPKWRRVRDVSAGQDDVHAAGVQYLPKLGDQSETDYKAYVKRTPFTNFTWRTFAALIGMIFRKPPNLEVPKSVEPFLEDVDLKGTPFTVFAQNVALEALQVEGVGILVDYPPAVKAVEGKPLTVADTEKMGLRPSMQLYPAETIINWKFRRINNRWVLSMVVLKELVAQPDDKDEFKDVEAVQYRVLDLDEAAGNFYRVRIFKCDDGGKDVLIEGPSYPMMNGKPLSEIPFIFQLFDEPPLIDLVDTNISHYMTSADHEHACHFTGLPTPYVTGWQAPTDIEGKKQDVKLNIGSMSAWLIANAEAKVGYLEYSGQGITSIENNLTRKEAAMAAIGARMLAPEKVGVEAAETLAIRHSGENSVLSQVSVNVGLMLKRALEIFSQWAGAEGEIKCDLNKDFLPFPMTPQQAQAYIALVQSGALSPEQLFELEKRADLVPPDLSYEDHQAQVDEGGMNIAIQTAQAMIDAQKQDKEDEEPPE